jgi:hypothetical protein
MVPVVVQVPVDESYNSAVLRTLLLLPPVINTFPFVNTDAVWSHRAYFILPVLDHPIQKHFNVFILG